MFRPQVCHSESIPATLLFSHNSLFFGHGNSSSSIPIRPRTSTTFQRIKGGGNRYNLSPNTIRAHDQVGAATEQSIAIKAVVTVQLTIGGLLTNLGVGRGLDDITDLMGKTLNLELVASHLNSLSEEKKVKGYAHRSSQESGDVKYECTFQVPASFGEVGAVLVQNEHHKEMYLKNIVLDSFPNGPVTITCNSWVASKFDNPAMRIFFPSKCYLPSQTPSGLKKLREAELVSLRGNGEGERKTFDRIYDYDKYNDLGDPDKSKDLARPVLGGPEHPYPRRCRTGRGPTKKDPKSEQRSSTVYVPRDEAFSEVKELTFSTNTLKSVLHAFVPALETAAINPDLGFPHFTAIDTLFNQGVPIPATNKGIFKAVLPRLVKALVDKEDDLLLFETPAIIGRDKFSWFRDEEFSRQTLAGLNPYSIQLVTEWPLKSKLDPKVYGPPESAITSELIEKEIKGCMTVDEALKNKKLFIIDYHDLLLPYVQKVRGLEGTTLYGSRTLFFLTEDDTLRPLAIELTRPPMDGKPQWKQVFSPGWDSTSSWLWKFAKAHATCHDSGYHQLVIHWLRTHCCMEPYIIAGNRQLSAMHPIYRLLHPHFRYTMEINALARESLINAGGIIESCFFPGKYSIELSSAAYDQHWRFDMEALPADLIRRGMAVEDPTAEHGVKLTIEDYPFANDGLVLWDAIKSWVTDYVSHYYPEAELIKSDSELQAWWSDVRNKGHADKKDEPWWPELNNQDDLVQILSTIIWVASGHHAAVNFGQYPYAGYFPNRPTIIRTNMPSEDPDEKTYKHFLDKPESSLLQSFPSQIQATKVMSVLDVLSSHSPDEEYLGELLEPSWSEDPVIKAAFERFSGKLQELDGIIDARNADLKLLNRTGAGVVPYQLLKPSSKPGVTGMGVPTSISI